jgi:hypothetical protein
MGKQDKIKSASVTPLGGPVSVVPAGYAPGAYPAAGYGPAVPEPSPTPAASSAWVEPTPAASMDQAQRLVDLSVERETMAVRLEEAQRQRTDLESRVNELAAGRADLERQLAQLQAEREQLSRQNKELEDEVLRLPEELAAVSNSRAFKILKAGPFMAMRQPLSTLLIIAGMGELTNLWSFSGLGSSVYIGVAAVVLVVTAVQFWASHD